MDSFGTRAIRTSIWLISNFPDRHSFVIIKSHMIGAEQRAEELVSQFLDQFLKAGTYLRENIKELAELATCDDEAIAKSATRAIFASLVERLSDAFDPASVSLYNRAFAQLIQHCRYRLPNLDRQLRSFGLASESQLLARAERLCSSHSGFAVGLTDKIERFIVLSRITLGADVAITSVIIERLKQKFPSAEIILIGRSKMVELLDGDRQLGFNQINYNQAGTLAEKLLSWTQLLDCLRSATRGAGSRCLVIDPDTRLTQLGILPVTQASSGNPSADLPEGYLFFPSRQYRSQSTAPVGELTSDWLNEVFGESETTRPRLHLSRSDLEAASQLISLVRRGGARLVVSVNFGVGENPAKRVGETFESSLVSRLIRQGATVILDRGDTQEESKRADAIINHAKYSGESGTAIKAIELDEHRLAETLRSENLDVNLMAWRGRIGLLAALIGESDLYIGYDSAGQHIAAALGVPCIDVFAGYTSPKMLERWRPATGQVKLIAVERSGDEQSILAAVMRSISGARLA
jgi:ADP-heptose:LPS heptosyltransferase